MIPKSSSADSPEILSIRVNDLSRGGAGVARDESGRVIFIPFTAPGDFVRVRIRREEKRYAQAELLEVLEPGPDRVKPPCPYFGRCGGCDWQHIPYELQWKTKVRGVEHALSRVGVALPKEVTLMPSPTAYGYRNRIQLRGNGEELGFYAKGSHRLVPIDRCEIAQDEINRVLPEVRSEARKLSEPYKVELEALPSGQVRRIWNAGHAAGGFRQVHDEQNQKMREFISHEITSGRELYDLYGGAGNLSLGLALRMAKIDVVDTSAPAERPEGTPENVFFHRSAVAPWLLRIARSAPKSKIERSAILDPPRIGLAEDFQETVKALEHLGVTEWIAVGCDPDQWSRDVSRLVKREWGFQKLAILDLFPQTPHIESIAVLRRSKH